MLELIKMALSLYAILHDEGVEEIHKFLELSERGLLTPENAEAWGKKLFLKYALPTMMEELNQEEDDDEDEMEWLTHMLEKSVPSKKIIIIVL